MAAPHFHKPYAHGAGSMLGLVTLDLILLAATPPTPKGLLYIFVGTKALVAWLGWLAARDRACHIHTVDAVFGKR